MHRHAAPILMILALAAAPAFAQADFKTDVTTEAKPWTHLNINNDPDSFQFAIVTDRTGGHRPGVFMDGVRKLNLLQPEFVVSVGDLIEGYTEDLERLNREWNEFDSFVAQLEMPFFYVPGNHDITNQVMDDLYVKRYGRKWYHFIHKDVLFLLLNSEDPPSSQMSVEQTDYARKVLADNPDVRWTLVFIHKPLWAYGDSEKNGWNRVEESLKGRRHSVFAGHTHRYYKHERNDSEYIVMATMGGGSRLGGPNFGQFDHFMWVTMTDEGPRFANLMLDGIWDTNVYTEKRGELIRPVASGAAVRTDGLVFDGVAFEEATVKLRLQNDADIPMKTLVSIPGTADITPSQRRIEMEIAPNSVELLDLALKAKAPLDPRSIQPLPVRWQVEYAVPGDLHPLRLEGAHRIIIDSRYQILPAASSVKVDGALDEWGSLTVLGEEPGYIDTDDDSWSGVLDASADIGVAYDTEFLYIAIDARDDEIRRSQRPDYLRQDSLLVRIDTRTEANRTTRAEEFKDMLLIALLPGEGGEKVFDAEKLPDGTQVQSRMTDTGYQAEIAVPLSYLRAQQGGDWSSVRINVGQNDIDADGRAFVWWRPEWTAPADYPHSGTFEKPAGRLTAER